MNKLSVKEKEQKAELYREMESAYAKLDEVVTAYNAALEALKAPVEDAVRVLNEAQEKAKEFTDGIVADMEAYYDDRSEKWQEGDVGSSFNDWKSEWEGFDPEEVDITFPDDLECPDSCHESLNDLPDSLETP